MTARRNHRLGEGVEADRAAPLIVIGRSRGGGSGVGGRHASETM
jgi:hypothetical protein